MDTRSAIAGMVGCAIAASAATIIVMPGEHWKPSESINTAVSKSDISPISPVLLALKETLINFDATLQTGADLHDVSAGLAGVVGKSRLSKSDLSKQQESSLEYAISRADAARVIWEAILDCRDVGSCVTRIYKPLQLLDLTDSKNLMFLALDSFPRAQAEQRNKFIVLLKQKVSTSINATIATLP